MLCAVQMAGKTEPLTQPDAVLTVLAPNDAAFQSIPGDILQALLDDMTGALAYVRLHVSLGLCSGITRCFDTFPSSWRDCSM